MAKACCLDSVEAVEKRIFSIFEQKFIVEGFTRRLVKLVLPTPMGPSTDESGACFRSCRPLLMIAYCGASLASAPFSGFKVFNQFLLVCHLRIDKLSTTSLSPSFAASRSRKS